MNVGHIDGSVTTIPDYQLRTPNAGNPSYYAPYNDRSDWGFWRWFGAGRNVP
jgi:hypothetical protein